MHYYKIKIIETEGRLNESAGNAPKVLYVESNECLSERQALIRASKKYKGMYGAKIVLADVEQISEGVWDSIKGAAAGVAGIGKGVGNSVMNGAKAVGNAVSNAVSNTAGKIKNNYVNNRNASRMKSIVNNITKIINSQLAPQVQSASKFGGFTVEQLQQIKGAIDQVMNGATVQNQQNNAQAQGPNAEEQAGGDLTAAAIKNAADTGEAEEDFI